MKKYIFTIAPGLVGITDSLLLDSCKEYASLKCGHITASLQVRGDVRVVFRGEAYRTPSEFPEELKAIIRGGAYDGSHEDELFIDDNNWFEVFVVKDGSNVFSDIAESLDECTEDAVFSTLRSFLQTYWDEYAPYEDEPAASELDEIRKGVVADIRRELASRGLETLDVCDVTSGTWTPVVRDDQYDPNNSYTLDGIDASDPDCLLFDASSCCDEQTFEESRVGVEALCAILEFLRDNADALDRLAEETKAA